MNLTIENVYMEIDLILKVSQSPALFIRLYGQSIALELVVSYGIVDGRG